jgi:hypothetical protein
MSKNQVGNVQYVDFKKESPTIVISEKSLKKTKKEQSPSNNVIRNFFIQNEIKTIISGKKDCKLTLISDVTNKEIYTKALKTILKSVKSSRKFKLQAC